MESHRSYTIRAICYFVLAMSTYTVQAGTEFRLSSNYNYPIVGLGTHGMKGDVLEKVLSGALEKGLRHINTGFIYENEEDIGKVLKKWFSKGGKREDLFITSKLPYYGNRPEEVEKYLKLSLEKLGLEYVDMYLIHTPFGVKHKDGSYELAKNEDGTVKLDAPTDYVAIWKEMEEQVKARRARSIGLSNFNETQVAEILSKAEIKPSNLEVEVHAYHQQFPLREFCLKHGIAVTGYAPLGSSGAREVLRPEQNPKDFPSLLKHPVVSEIAKNHGKSTAQILLRHAVQGQIAVIPGSKNPDHLVSNLDIFDFELTDDEVQRMNALDKGEDGKVFNYKFFKGIEKHPQYPFLGVRR